MSQANPPTGPIGKMLALVAGTILLVLGFMFSLVLLAVFVAVGLMLGPGSSGKHATCARPCAKPVQ